MVVEVTNPANNGMHYGDKPAVSVIPVPDKLPNRILYTNVEANRIYNDLQYDIYQTQKEHDRIIKKPKSWKTWLTIFAAATLVTLGVVYRKNLVSLLKNGVTKIKNIFHKP